MTIKKIMVRHKISRTLLRKLNNLMEQKGRSSIPYSAFGMQQRIQEDYDDIRESLGFQRKYNEK